MTKTGTTMELYGCGVCPLWCTGAAADAAVNGPVCDIQAQRPETSSANVQGKPQATNTRLAQPILAEPAGIASQLHIAIDAMNTGGTAGESGGLSEATMTGDNNERGRIDHVFQVGFGLYMGCWLSGMAWLP